MRSLSFVFALLVGLVLAFIAPALAGGQDVAPEPMILAMDQSDLEPSEMFSAADLLSSIDTDFAPAVVGTEQAA